MRKIGMLCCALVLCVSIPMTIIRSSEKQKPVEPARPPDRQPIFVHPEKEGPFRFPTYRVPEKEKHGDLTADRPGEKF